MHHDASTIAIPFNTWSFIFHVNPRKLLSFLRLCPAYVTIDPRCIFSPVVVFMPLTIRYQSRYTNGSYIFKYLLNSCSNLSSSPDVIGHSVLIEPFHRYSELLVEIRDFFKHICI